MKSIKPILMVEDDRVDAMTVERAMRDLNISNDLVHVGDGEQALEYLNHPNQQTPCIILLDLNMPRMNGIEFLQVIKQDDLLKMIPVIVLTSSQDEKDKLESFRLGVSGYMIKPVGYQQFVDVVRTIELYWTLSELPPLA
jgi:CheY-like chemotaxis protein